MIYTDDKLTCAGDSLMTPCRAGKFVQVLAAGLVLLIEGGQWFWPPVRVGFVRNLPGTPYQLPGRRECIAYSAGNLLSAVAAFFSDCFLWILKFFFFHQRGQIGCTHLPGTFGLALTWPACNSCTIIYLNRSGSMVYVM